MAMKDCKEVALASSPVEPRVLKDGENGKCVGNNNVFACNLYSRERKIVCVTSGNSYFGAHLIKKLLARGYLVRVTIQYQGTTSLRYNDIQPNPPHLIQQ